MRTLFHYGVVLHSTLITASTFHNDQIGITNRKITWTQFFLYTTIRQ